MSEMLGNKVALEAAWAMNAGIREALAEALNMSPSAVFMKGHKAHHAVLTVSVSYVKKTPKFFLVRSGTHDGDIWIDRCDKNLSVVVHGGVAEVTGTYGKLVERKLLPAKVV